MRRAVQFLVVLTVLALVLVMAGCGGSSGTDGAQMDTARKPEPPPPPPPVPDGTLVGHKQLNRTGWGVLTMATDGTNETNVVPGVTPCWSPDGQTICFVQDSRVYTVPASGGTPEQFTTGAEPDLPAGDSDISPEWSPDGQEIAFLRQTGSYPAVYTICVKQFPDGPGRQLCQGDGLAGLSWSPDGAYVMFRDDGNLSVVPSAGGAVYRVSETLPLGNDPAWFADVETGANRVAYCTGAYAPGGGQVFTLQVDAAGHAIGDPIAITSDRPGWPTHPTWSPDGTYIAYSDEWAGKKGEVFVTCIVEVATGTLTEVGDLGGVDWTP